MLNARNEYSNINNQINQVQQNLNNIRANIVTYENEVRDLQKQYSLLNINMGNLKTEQNKIDTKITKVQEQISQSRTIISNCEENLQNLEAEKNTLKVRLEQFTQETKEVLDLIPNIMANYKKIEGWGKINLGAQLVEIIPNKELEKTDLFKELSKDQDDESFNKIIEKIGDINIQDKDGRTLLMHCLINGFHSGTKKLLDMKANVNLYDKDGMNAMLYSGQFPHAEYTKKIIDLSRDVRVTSPTCNNMNIGHLLVSNLHLTQEKNSLDEAMAQKHIGQLLETIHKRDPHLLQMQDGMGHNIFSIAASLKYFPLALNMISKKFFDIEYENKRSSESSGQAYNIIIDAISTHNIEFFKDVLKLTGKSCDIGIDEDGINFIGQENTSPLHIALEKGDLPMAEFLINKNAYINFPNKDGIYPLHMACSKKYLAIARKLIEKGVDVNAQDNSGNTPLHSLGAYYYP